jgi:serine/threonine protein kinase
MEKYEKAEELGRGTFGTVFAATVKATGNRVAIKRINLGNTRDDVEGIHFTALREIKYLQENIHPHVVSVRSPLYYSTFTFRVYFEEKCWYFTSFNDVQMDFGRHSENSSTFRSAAIGRLLS